MNTTQVPLDLDLEEVRREGNAYTRIGSVVWRMAALGWQPTTREVRNLTGLEMGSAWKMMNELSSEIPIRLDENGRWVAIRRDDLLRVDGAMLG